MFRSLKLKINFLSKVLDDLYSSSLKKELVRKGESLTNKLISSGNKDKFSELDSAIRPFIQLTKEIKIGKGICCQLFIKRHSISIVMKVHI